MKRPIRNLTEPPDVVLAVQPKTFKAWVQGGPCDGTIVEVPEGTESIFAYEPAPEMALTLVDAYPRMVRYVLHTDGGFLRFKVNGSRRMAADPVAPPRPDRCSRDCGENIHTMVPGECAAAL